MAMVAATMVALLSVSLALFLGLWWLIDRETSEPQVMDRAEAERRAIEQGGRGSETNDDHDATDRTHDDDDVGWDD